MCQPELLGLVLAGSRELFFHTCIKTVTLTSCAVMQSPPWKWNCSCNALRAGILAAGIISTVQPTKQHSHAPCAFPVVQNTAELGQK